MFDFVPLLLYTPLYYYIMLVFVMITFLHTQTVTLGNKSNFSFLKTMGIIVLLFVFLYMALRPISGVFVDMWMYNYDFERYQEDGADYLLLKKEDYIFNYFTYYSSLIMTAEMYFLTCAALYIIPLYLVTKKWFGDYWYYGFLTLAISFSFWAYGTNGIRNGIATSLFLLAVSRERWFWKIVFLYLAINFHKTMMLPAIAYLIAYFYNRPKYFLAFWFLCIPLSLVAGSFFQGIFASLFDDDRAEVYLTMGNIANDNFSSTGFRWDFLLYSATAVFAGYYYIFKSNYRDKLYSVLFCTYLFANAFWILVIKANFSNRFAYLSWFMMAVVIFYPLLKVNLIENQHKKIGYIILSYFAFTFLMNVILAK